MRLDADVVQRWRQQLGDSVAEPDGLTDAERIDLLTALEDLKGAAAGKQAVVTVAFDVSQRDEQAVRGVPAQRLGRGVAAQVGLARRESPFLATRHLGLAKALVHEMPHTLAALTGGRITEWHATVIVRETACLTRDDRSTVDAEIAGAPARVDELQSWSTRRLTAELLRLAVRLDVGALLKRRRRAVSERRVSGRPAPDTMMYLTALLTARDGVAVLAALRQAADTAVAAGDCRTRDQIMADTLVARVTGREPAEGSSRVTVNIVISDEALFAHGDDSSHETADLAGYGPIPAELARELALGERARLRRLYARPGTRELVAMESRSRLFPTGLADLIKLRDQTCRTPWCDAPIRHTDHVVPHAAGGVTSAANGQGLCAACNQAKEAPGWQGEPAPGERHTVSITTPTGHTYRSTAPPLAG